MYPNKYCSSYLTWSSSIHHPDILDKLLAELTDPAAPRNKTVPGIALVIRSKDGRVIYSQGNGSFDVNTPSWLASCTKLVTPIALLQLVRKGLSHWTSQCNDFFLGVTSVMCLWVLMVRENRCSNRSQRCYFAQSAEPH